MPRFDADYIPSSAMTIFAHPDDAEFSVAGTLARWARAGCRVTMVLCTSGNVGTQDSRSSAGSLTALREEEQREAARILGVQDLVFLRHDDCQLQPTLDLRRELVTAIRGYRPEVVVCSDPSVWFFGGGFINHPDHRAAATAALDAAFPCAEMPLLWPDAGLPHKVQAVYVGWREDRDVWIDIGDTLSTKIDALRAHASQMGTWDPTEMITGWAGEDATELRARHEAATRSGAEPQVPAEEPNGPAKGGKAGGLGKRAKAGKRGKASKQDKRREARRNAKAERSAEALAPETQELARGVSWPRYTESFKVIVLQADAAPPES